MRKLASSYDFDLSFDDDLPLMVECLASCCSCHQGGLCSPNDPLDKVPYLPVVEDSFLRELGIVDCSPPRPNGRTENAPTMPILGIGVGKNAATMPAGGGVDNSMALDTDETPPSPVHSVSSSTASESSSYSPSSASSDDESSPMPVPTFKCRTAPRKVPPFRPPAAVRKRPWPLALPAVLGARDSNGRNIKLSVGIRGKRHWAGRQGQRKCSHCQTSETPQWRAGPRGRGTLCNACGIRYTSNNSKDKLVPEYRPSTSPSFRSDVHSNRHRKVLELREKKEKNIVKMFVGV